ncbi:MAG: hypothetical protein OCD01_04155 [Fibrobacterales bacterium]
MNTIKTKVTESIFLTNAWVYLLVLVLLPIANKIFAQHFSSDFIYKVSANNYFNPVSIFITILVKAIWYVWIWCIVIVFSQSTKKQLRKSLGLFKVAFVLAVICNMCFSEVVLYYIDRIIELKVVLGIFIVSMVFISWEAAKQLRSFELGRLSTFKETFSSFVAVLFLPLGVFWLQPKLKVYWNTLIKRSL